MDGWVWRSLCQLLQRGRAPARRPDGPSAPFPWCSGSPPSWPRQHAVPKSFLCAGPCADQGWWQRQAGNQAWRAGRPLPETSTPEGRVGLVLTAFPAPQKDSAHSRCSASVRPLRMDSQAGLSPLRPHQFLRLGQLLPGRGAVGPLYLVCAWASAFPFLIEV